jgi:hypothetical protein
VADLGSSCFSGATSEDVTAFSTAVCAGMTSDQVYGMGDNCAGFSSTCLNGATTDAVGGFVAKCLTAWSADARAGVTAAVVGAMSSDALASCTDLSGFGDACSGFSATQVGEFASYSTSSAACKSISTKCAAAIPASSYGQLGSMCAAQFVAMSALSADQVGAIPADSFSGVTGAVLQGLEKATCAGLTASQIGNLASYSTTSTACANITASCASGFADDALSSINGACLGSFDAEGAGAISTAALASASDDAFSSVSADFVSGLGANCAGLVSSQIANVGSYSSTATACSGFGSTCIGVITQSAAAGFQDTCVKYFSSDAMNGLTSTQVAGMMGDAFDMVTAEQLANLTADACHGLTSPQLGSFGSLSSSSGACAGLSATCIANMTTSAVAGFQDTCVKSIDAAGIGGLTREQVAAMPSDVFDMSPAAQLAGLSADGCAGLTSPQVSNFGSLSSSSGACAGLTAKCLGAVTASTMGGFQDTCVRYLSTDAVASLAKDQVAGMASDAFDMSNATVLGALTKDGCSGFTSAQLGNLGSLTSSSGACVGLTPACITGIPTSAMGGLEDTCVRYLSTAATAALVGTQVTAMASDAFDMSGAAQLAALTGDACSGFLSAQLSNLGSLSSSSGACAGITVECAAALVTKEIGGVEDTCFRHWQQDTIAALSADQVAACAGDAFDMMNATALASFNTSACAGFTGVQTGNFATLTSSADACTGLTYDCLTTFTKSAVGGLDSQCVQSFNDTYYTKFPVSWLEQLSDGGTFGIDAGQLAIAVTKHGKDLVHSSFRANGMTFRASHTFNTYFDTAPPSQSGVFKVYDGAAAMDTWLSTTFSSAASMKDVESFKGVPGSSAAGLRAVHIPNLSVDAFASMKGGQQQHLHAEAVAVTTGKQVNAWDCAAWQSFSLLINVTTDTQKSVTTEHLECFSQGNAGTSYLTGWPCSFVTKFSKAQLLAVIKYADTATKDAYRRCADLPVTPSPPTPPPTPSPYGPTPSPSPSPSPPGGMPGWGIALVSITVTLVVGGALAFGYLRYTNKLPGSGPRFETV